MFWSRRSAVQSLQLCERKVTHKSRKIGTRFVHFNVITRLLNEVVASAGVDIRTAGDCHTLSEVITARTGKVVNYNTLRRMYGLAKPVKPSRGSLDILSEFVGFDSYLHFTSGSPRLHSTRTKEEVYLRFARGQDAEAIALLREMPESTLRSDMVIQMGRELFVSGDTARALSFLALAEPLVAELPYSEIVHVGNSIGIARGTLASVSGLINHHAYQRMVHSLFVDYPHLSGYYGAEVDALEPGRAHSPEFELFTTCLGMFRNFLLGLPVEGELPEAPHTLDFHPILQGRLFACHMMTGVHDSPQDAWVRCFGEGALSDINLEFAHELFLFAAMSNDPNLVQWCLQELPISKKPAQRHEQSALHTQRLLKCMARTFRGDLSSARMHFEKFDLHETHILHRDILDMCRCVLGHRLFQKQQPWKRRYNELASRLGVTRFDDAFFKTAYRKITTLQP
jgi:hypothetical protein